ncbi:MAG: hypothetical protein AAB225_04980 [Acidobacteriota bacterium]
MSKLVLLTAGLLATCASTTSERLDRPDYRQDPRLARLTQFLTVNRCPVAPLAEQFLYSADLNSLDWRLLPSISLVESGGGRKCANNNIFGWDEGRTAFSSVREGIHTVASRLANSKLYKKKDLKALLRTYNPYPEYPARVESTMRRLSPTAKAAGYPSNSRIAK